MSRLLLPAFVALLASADAAAKAQPKVVSLEFEKTITRRSEHISNIFRRDDLAPKSSEINNDAQVSYSVSASLGTEGQQVTLKLDTGSSDLIIPKTGAPICNGGSSCKQGATYDDSKSSTWVKISDNFTTDFTDKSKYTGTWGQDTVSIAGANVQNVSIGLMSGAEGIPADQKAPALLGLAFQSQKTGDEAANNTFISQMHNQGLINSAAYSLWLNDVAATKGSILFGGVDSAKYKGPLGILNITEKMPGEEQRRLAVTLTGLKFTSEAGVVDLMANTKTSPFKAILDSGVTDVKLPENIVDSIFKGLGVSNTKGAPSFPCFLNATANKFTFQFGGSSGPSIDVGLNQFIAPWDKAYKYSNNAPACAFLLRNINNPDGQVGAILGDSFLRSAYVMFDLSNNKIGLAPTVFNATESKIVEVESDGSVASTASDAVSTVTENVTAMKPTATVSLTEIEGTGLVQLTPTFGNIGTPTAAASSVRVPAFSQSFFGIGAAVAIASAFGGSLLLW